MNLYRESDNTLVNLPGTLPSFRGEMTEVIKIAMDSRPGSSGKIELADGTYKYPGVVRCYIADEPRTEIPESKRPAKVVQP